MSIFNKKKSESADNEQKDSVEKKKKTSLNNKDLPLFSARISQKSATKIEQLTEEYKKKFGRKPESKGELLDFILCKIPNKKEKEEVNCWENYKSLLLEYRKIQDGLIEGISDNRQKWNELNEKIYKTEWEKLCNNIASIDNLNGTDFNPAQLKNLTSLSVNAAKQINDMFETLLKKIDELEENSFSKVMKDLEDTQENFNIAYKKDMKKERFNQNDIPYPEAYDDAEPQENLTTEEEQDYSENSFPEASTTEPSCAT